MTVYENQDGETFYRRSDCYGDTGEYDVQRASKAELDAWLTDHGFHIIGYENDEDE